MKRDDNDVDARGEAAQGEEIASRSHDGLRSERTTSNLEVCYIKLGLTLHSKGCST